ncbi:MAG: EpsG family protein [Hyphomicrobiales bacterium]|nr:EpsG family protein [Hyphomicrobiales bacterium]
MSLYFLAYLALLIAGLMLPQGKIFVGDNRHLKLYRTTGFKWEPQTVILLVIIGLLAGFRGLEIGIDYRGYYEFYQYTYTYGRFWLDRLLGSEIGWHYINLLASHAGLPGGVFFGILSAVTWYFFIKGSYRYQYLLPLMLFFVISVGFLFWTWSGIRQSIAIMMFFFSIKYIIEKNPINYLALIALGSLFHLSISIMAPVYFVSYIKYKKKIALIAYIISLGFTGFFSLSILIEPLANLFSQIAYLKPYLRLLSMERFQEAREVTGTNLGFLLKAIFTIWIILQSDKITKDHKEFEIYIILYLAYAVLANVFFSLELVGRAINYFFICFPIVAAATIRVSTGKLEQQVSLAFLSAFFVLYLVTTYKLLSNALGY